MATFSASTVCRLSYQWFGLRLTLLSPSTQFSAAGYLRFRPSYPTWVYELIAQYHATGQIDAQSLLAAQQRSVKASSIKAPPAKSGVRWERALDLGCGPGLGSVPLLSYFDSVVALDPSQKMIDQALRDPTGPSLPEHIRPHTVEPNSVRSAVTHAPVRGQLGSISYLVDNGLTLSNYLAQHGVKGPEDVPDEAKADLVVAFQAAHWLTPYKDLWSTLDRVVRPGGSTIVVTYSEVYLPEYPSLTELITQFTMGKPWPDKQDGLGPYWESGRHILNDGMIDLPAPWVVQPKSNWDKSSFVRRIFSNQDGTNVTNRWPEQTTPAPEKEGTSGGAPISPAELQAAAKLTMSKPADWDTLRGYLSTFSSLHNYRREHPDDQKNSGGIVERFIQRLQRGMLEGQRAKDSQASLPQHFTLQWPVHVVGVKKQPVN